MTPRTALFFFLGLYFTAVNTVLATVNDDLQHFFEALGDNTNTTAPNAYKGQQAGYYTGGSVVARNSVRNLQIAEIHLPSVRSGCGGIDAFAGGFSFVNSDELVKVMRNVLNNAKGYAFTLALETVTPQIANTMKYMQDMANKVNQANINSCELSEELVGGLWPKTRSSQQRVCQDIGANSGVFADWADARQGCTSDAWKSTLDKGSKDEQYKDLVFNDSNIAWRALQKIPLATNDPELAELLMSLSGSLIVKTTTDGTKMSVLPSLASNHNLLKAILYGASTMVYHCDEQADCLNPKLETLTISSAQGLKNQVSALLASIAKKIMQDEALNASEIALLQSTRFPLYKILNVQAAYQKDTGIVDIESDSDVIALDILFQYLQENMALVHTASQTLSYPSEMMAEFNRGMDTALASVRAEQHSAQNQISIALQRIEQAQMMEQMLAGSLSTELTHHLDWGRGLH